MKVIIYASHIENEDKILLIQKNMEYLKLCVDLIYIIYSIKEQDIKLKNKLIDIYDDNSVRLFYVENSGYDFWKYKQGIELINSLERDYTILMNDSITITRQVDELFNTINDNVINNNIEYLGLLESTERIKHYQSWFWVLTPKVLEYFDKNILKIKYENKDDNIKYYELRGSNALIKLFKSKSLYNFDVKKNIFYHHPEKYIEALQDGFPIIKNNLFSKKFMKSHRLNRDKKIDSFISPEILSILGNLQ